MWSATRLRTSRSGGIVLAALLSIVVPVDAVDAQSGDVPRTADGRPDLNGLWQALGNAHWDLEPHVARPALQTQEGPVVPVPANEVLYLGTLASVPSRDDSIARLR